MLELPIIPTDAVGKRTFMNGLRSSVAKIDRSSNDVLTQWISMCDEELGDSDEVFRKFHNNSQGLDRLDRFLGSLFGQKGVSHPTFGVKFSTYME